MEMFLRNRALLSTLPQLSMNGGANERRNLKKNPFTFLRWLMKMVNVIHIIEFKQLFL